MLGFNDGSKLWPEIVFQYNNTFKGAAVLYLDYSVPWTELIVNFVILDCSLFHHYSKFLICPPPPLSHIVPIRNPDRTWSGSSRHGHGFGPADELACGEAENESDPFASLPHGFMKRNRVHKACLTDSALWTM